MVSDGTASGGNYFVGDGGDEPGLAAVAREAAGEGDTVFRLDGVARDVAVGVPPLLKKEGKDLRRCLRYHGDGFGGIPANGVRTRML